MLHLLESHHKLLDYLLVAAVTNLFSKLVITQFPDQLKATDTSQLINGISNVFPKLLKCFHGTVISTILWLLYLHNSLQQ